MVAKRTGKCTAKIVVRYSRLLIPEGDIQGLIALSSGPLAEVGLTVIGALIPKTERRPTPTSTDEGD